MPQCSAVPSSPLDHWLLDSSLLTFYWLEYCNYFTSDPEASDTIVLHVKCTEDMSAGPQAHIAFERVSTSLLTPSLINKCCLKLAFLGFVLHIVWMVSEDKVYISKLDMSRNLVRCRKSDFHTLQTPFVAHRLKSFWWRVIHNRQLKLDCRNW